MSGKFVGLEQQKERLRAFIESVPKVTHEEILDLGNRTCERAKALVPVKSGNLQRGIRCYSNSYNSITIYAKALNKRTGYDYAPIQHNNKDYYHSVGEYMFLTKAFRIEINNFRKRVTRRLKY